MGRILAGLGWLGVALLAVSGTMAVAQARDVWIQIEAQPTRTEAEERARAYASAFPDVAAFDLSSGWHAIALGPYDRPEAEARLSDLRQERLIPSDSFLVEAQRLGARFFGSASPLAAAPAPVVPPPVVPDEPAIARVPDETEAEARAAEAALTITEREALQTALQWFGFYDAGIDGAFGPGTRAAMAAWQAANAAEPTGLLTSRQRAALTGAHQAALAELGLETVTEMEAGIEIILPLALVAFDAYEPPFVRFAPRDGSGVSVLLISQPGDEQALAGLYDLMQTLALVPPQGDRSLTERAFSISGRDARIESVTRVELRGGLIKGYTLAWPVAEGARLGRALSAMQASFRPVGDRALDPGLAPLDAATRAGMILGLDAGRPDRVRSGFFVDAAGTVLTTPDAVTGCGRITIDGDEAMRVSLTDAASGLAVLVPERPLSPPGVAAFQAAPEAPGLEVAVAGYPFEDALPSPTLTFGTVEALAGLDGEAGVKRLALPARDGDAGGPVLDGTGAVIGMLLARETAGARQLPDEVVFAASAETIARRLGQAGIAVAEAPAQGALPPEDLTRKAVAMTVRVSCWP